MEKFFATIALAATLVATPVFAKPAQKSLCTSEASLVYEAGMVNGDENRMLILFMEYSETLGDKKLLFLEQLADCANKKDKDLELKSNNILNPLEHSPKWSIKMSLTGEMYRHRAARFRIKMQISDYITSTAKALADGVASPGSPK